MTSAGAVLAAMRELPFGTPSQILGKATPIILAPHPDDEVIGCGGLIAELTSRQIQPVIVFVTDGSGSHPHSRKFPRPALIELRQREAHAAAEILGVDAARLYFMRLCDTAAPHEGPGLAEAVATIIDIATRYAPAVMLAPWACDPHGDHLAVHKMAARAAQEIGARHLSFPVWGWTLAEDAELDGASVAGWRLPVCRDLKARALRAHRSQLTDLIDDDPSGFRLDAPTMAMMLSDYEVFLVNP